LTSSNTAFELELAMNKHCMIQIDMCDALEEIADSLPRKFNKQQCLQVAHALYPSIKSAHEFEEQYLFPTLDSLTEDDKTLGASLERLRFEHWEDESYSQELAETLLDWVRGQSKYDPETIGYMLRGFFEGLRRHIAFEREHIIPKFHEAYSDNKS